MTINVITIKKILNILNKKDKRKLVLLLLLILVLGFFEVAGIASVLPFMELLSKPDALESSQILTQVYDRLKFESYSNFVIFTGSFIIATITFANLLGLFLQYYQLKFCWNISHRMSTNLLKVYSKKPYSFYLKQNTSDLRAYLLNEVLTLTSGVIIPIIEFISRSVICVIILGLLLVISPLATVVMGGLLGGSYMLIYITQRKVLKRLGKEKIESNANRFRYLEEMLTGIKTVKTYAAQKFFFERFENESKKFSLIEPRVQMTYATPKFILEILSIGGVLAVTMYFFVTSGDLLKSLPRLALYAIAGFRLLPALQKAFSAIAKVKHSMPSLHKLYDDLLIARDLEDVQEKSVTPMSFEKQIELKDISFQYDNGGNQILNKLSLNIKKGDTVAFVGSTGSGKTTLIDILTGLLSPSAGELVIDDTLVTPENIESWQRNIAYVPQDVYLYDDTIKANVTFGNVKHAYDEDRMIRALEMAGISQFILKELPDGLNAMIGERGVRLSGGQRQRLGLARALYSKPTLLVLDEATSALDNITEKGIIESLLSLPKEITIVIIAHRLSTVQHANTIFILENGGIVGKGTYKELVESNQTFKEMDHINWNKHSEGSAITNG